MLRINLLPSYVGQRRLTRTFAVISVAALLLCIFVPLTGWIALKSKLNTVTAEAAQAVAGKAVTDQRKALAASTLAAVGPIQTKLDFVNQVNAYTRKWVALYNTLADKSPRASLIYTDASVSGTTMTIKAYAPNIAEVGRYLQVMYQEPDFTSVSIDKIPGYPDSLTHKYYLDGRLVFADTASAGSAAGNSPGSNNTASGGTTGSPNSPPPNFNPESLSPTGPSNIPPDVGPPPPELTGDAAPAAGGGGGASGGTAAAGSYSPAFLEIVNHKISPFATPDVRNQLIRQQLKRVVMKTEPRGFDITVTATLKQALSPPAVPGSAGAAGGGPGGPGGPMGGPGAPPGSAA